MRIVAGQTIANRRRVHSTLDVRGIFLGVAGEAELVRRGRDQLYVSVISVDPDFMATQAAHGDRGMDKLALRFVLVAGDAGRGIGLWIEWNRMLRSGHTASGRQQHYETPQRG